jgi:hypothetical protein
MLGISIGLNSLSVHGTCTAVFVAVAAIAGFCLASIQTLGKLGWLAWLGLFGILSSSTSPCHANSPKLTNHLNSHHPHYLRQPPGPPLGGTTVRPMGIRL